MPTAAIVAVGTEVTTGEIINSNATWISQRLVDAGFKVALHEAVPDERPLMLSALTRAASVADQVFVTGGLGPTTDDFTREVIADWAERKLVWDEPSWQRIVTRLNSLNVPIAESNRQQCHFPDGATILPNRQGTASGFKLEAKSTTLWTLPGPPSELQTIWTDHIAPSVAVLVPDSEKLVLRTWNCLGQSESALGELVERCLEGSRLTTGYRAHIPWVTVKVWHAKNKTEEAQPWIDKLTQALAPWCVTRDHEDLTRELVERLHHFGSVHVLDAATSGILADKLGRALREHPTVRVEATRQGDIKVTFLTTDQHAGPEQTEKRLRAHLMGQRVEDLTLAVFGINSEGWWSVGMKLGNEIKTESFQVRYKSREFLERGRRSLTEQAIWRWHSWLK